MTSEPSSATEAGPSRRAVLTAGLAVGGGLLLGFRLALRGARAEAAGGIFAPDAFIRVSPSGQVTVIVPFVEMGQGTYTSVPMLVAEELEVGLDQIQVEHAPSDEKRYTHPIWKGQLTGGSGSIRGAYQPMRRAGAAARMMLISAAARSWGVDAETCRAERGWVIHPPSGRRMTYGSLASTAARIPVPEQVVLKDPKDFKLIGTPAKRLDTPDKVNGRAKFGIDVRVPGMRIAAVASCPVFGGKLAAVEDAGARAIRGVQQVVRIEDAVAVVADHTWAARKGLAALRITWDPGPNAGVSTAEIARDFSAASHNVGVVAANGGDIDSARPVRKVEAFYEMPFLAHAAMEPLSCTIHARKDACDIWVGTQFPPRGQNAAARVLGVPPEKVVLHNHLLGGGFGRRLEHDWIEQAARIARHVDGPVKVTWSREEDIQHDAYRSYNCSRVSAGLDQAGMPLTFHHRVVGPAVLARFLPLFFKDGVDLDAVDDALGPYAIPNVRVEFVRKEAPPGMLTGNWRGVGAVRNVFVVEGFIDELAHAARKDPVEYRRALIQRSPRALAVLELAARNAGWGKPLPRRSGRGVAVYSAFGTYLAQVAEISVGRDGRVRVHRMVCAVDCGQVINPDTVKAQIEGGVIYGLGAALYGPITLKNGRVEQSNFDTYPVPRMNEVPAVEVQIIPSQLPPGGIGELGTVGVAPAVVNAVTAATGKRLRNLPIDPAVLKLG